MSLSSLDASVAETRKILGLDIGFGVLDGVLDEDGGTVPCIVGPNESAPEIYVIARCDAKTGRYRDDVVMLGFDGPPLARAVFFAQATSPKEYRQLDTWQAADFADWLDRGADDSPFAGDSAE